jgi:hypothetical protein
MWTQIRTATTVAAVVLAALTLARAAVAEPVETRVFSSAARGCRITHSQYSTEYVMGWVADREYEDWH